jgi:hypothetical protein
MRFVPLPQRVRDLLVLQRPILTTALRIHFAEFGIMAPKGIHRINKLSAEVPSPALPVSERDDALATRREAITARSMSVSCPFGGGR